MSKLKIFFGVNESGVAYWRGKVPAWAIQRANLADVMMFSVYNTTPEESEAMLKRADVVYCPSPCGIDHVVEYIKYYQLGKATVADYDDNLFDCHPFNPGYATLGLKEVKIKLPQEDGTISEDYLWKDQRQGFSLKDNKMRFMAHVDVLTVSSLVTTTTSYLQNILAKNTQRPKDEFHVIPNSIDFNVYKPFPLRRRGKKVRIGWAASDSHLAEGALMIKIIKKLFAKRNDFEFLILGNMGNLRIGLREFPIEWHEFTDISVYPYKLASLELDIGLCPLEDCSFNLAKSALKWTEYSALKIATVAQDMEPYKEIRDGIDGFLASTEDQFIEKIETLIENEKIRRDMAEAAWQRNYEDFNIDKNAALWMEAFERAHLRDEQITYQGKPIPRQKDLVNAG